MNQDRLEKTDRLIGRIERLAGLAAGTIFLAGSIILKEYIFLAPSVVLYALTAGNFIEDRMNSGECPSLKSISLRKKYREMAELADSYIE